MTDLEAQLSIVDAGDDMQRRLRYQAACGAIMSLDLFVLDDLEAVFCEHHEDFLIKKKSGRFIGVQVKTQLTAIGPFKSNDPAILSALSRFVALEKEFPDKFDAYLIVANCDFYDVQDSETNLRFVVQRLSANPQASFTGTAKKLIDDLRAANSCSKKLVRATIAKVRVDGSSPKFEDVVPVLASKIGRVRRDISSYPELQRCADSILNHVLKASALPCDQVLRSHLVLSSSPDEAAVLAAVEHKRITHDTLSALITNSTEILLTSASGNMVRLTFPFGSHRLEKKMAIGGISATSIEVAKDHQTSAEHALQEWIARYGGEVADERCTHIDVAVRTRCAEAFDETYSDTAPFGSHMLAEVRKKIGELSIDKQHVLGLSYEQLLGFVSLATQQCKVWWSDRFDFPGATDVIV